MEADKAVDAYLEAQRIKFSAAYRGVVTRDGWESDHWHVDISRDTRSTYLEFYTGLGNRQAPKRGPFAFEVDRGNPREVHAWRQKHAKPVPPTAASVLYCMLSDAQAGQGTFRDFCSDFGYSDDSIKALNTYTACQDMEHKLRAVFMSEHREELARLLENY